MGSQPSLPEVNLVDKTIVVTGANTGIGYETAKTLAQAGAKVIVACRSQSKATEAIERMKKEHVEEKADPKKQKVQIKVDDLNVEFMALDLGSLESTMTFVEAYKSKGLPLHVLVCNAGIMFGPEGLSYTEAKRLSQDRNKWRKTTRRSADVVANRQQLTVAASQVMHMFSLAQRLEGSGVNVFSLHPGVVNTELGSRDGQQVPGYVKLFSSAGRKLLRNPFDGALTSLHAAANPAYDD